MQEYINMWKNYANFSGRTSRRGYWMAFLFNVIAGFIVGFISGFLSVFIPAMTIIGTLYTIVMIVHEKYLYGGELYVRTNKEFTCFKGDFFNVSFNDFC